MSKMIKILFVCHESISKYDDLKTLWHESNRFIDRLYLI